MVVSLTKGNSVSLKKTDGTELSRIILGLGWDAASRGFFSSGKIDLDASAIIFHSSGKSEVVYFGNLNSSDGSVHHTGDNLTGDGDGDDERIVVDLTSLPHTVTSIVFTINSYSGQKFDKVKNVFARVVDASQGREQEVVRYNLAESYASTANVVAKVSKVNGSWAFTAIGQFANGRTAHELESIARNFAN